MITLVIGGKNYEVVRSILKQQMKNVESNQLDKKNLIQLPSWVQNQEFQVINEYFNFVYKLQQIQPKKNQAKINQFLSKSILTNPKLNNSKKLIHIMRVSDYLTLQKFQHYFIQKCVIQTLNHQNCIIYLEETHKKLKNSSSGTAQAWYNLLNACIDFISYNLSQVYFYQPERIQKLHQKILSQILDRTIKYQVLSSSRIKNIKKSQTDDSKQKQIIFNLLMKSKKANSVDVLCNALKLNLLNKKINKKMHAKLSWKLHDLDQIVDKKVKNFKFLQLNWILEAVRTSQQNLKIKLTLLPIEIENSYGNNYSIGVFYSKLYWNVDKMGSSEVSSTQNTHSDQQASEINQGQKQLQIHYICLKNSKALDIFQIDSSFQGKIYNKKLQLSIYCSIDHCYSFVINYIINDYNRLRLDFLKMCKQQIYALIQGSKSFQKYSQAVWLIKYLAKNELQIPVNLLQNLPYDKLPTYETQFLRKLVRNDNTILDEVFGKKQINEKALQIQNEIRSLQSSKVSDNQETGSNKSRGGSKGRHRKIFGESPQKQVNSNNSIGQQRGKERQQTKQTKQKKQIKQVKQIKQAKQMREKGSDRQGQKTSKQSSNSEWDIRQKQPFAQLNGKLQTTKEQRLREIMQIIDIKNYFYDKKSSILSSL